MTIFTTESQRHREIEGQKDHRTSPIIGAAIEHRHVGPGLLESAYEECLCHELHLRGLSFERQVALPVSYKGSHLDWIQNRSHRGTRNNCRVEGNRENPPGPQAQLLTYLKISGKRVGLLINFNVRLLTQGIVRRIL